MEVAVHSIQQELNNVNNLWKWPSEMSGDVSPSSPNSYISIEFGKWYREISHTGYKNANSGKVICGSFTDHSMMTYMSGSNYSMGVFLDLPPQVYTLECMADIPSNTVFVEYMKFGDMWLFVKSQKSEVLQVGVKSKTSFTVPDGCCILMLLRPQQRGTAEAGPYATFTDIVIREGI